MPFMIYDVEQSGKSALFSFVKKVQIAGSGGPLKKHHDARNSLRKHPFPWHASDRDILSQIPGADIGQQIIVDLKPLQKGNISLYRLLDVWGFSYYGWTPLGVLLESLFVDREENNAESFKRQFTDKGAKRELVGEFLYLQGGAKRGNWNLGMVGGVNGALLWADAFDYLTGQLSRAFKDYS